MKFIDTKGRIEATRGWGKKGMGRDLQDGGGVRCGDHHPPHKYIKNTSTRGTALTEHMLNTGRRPQTPPKARNSPRTWVGQKKKEKTETKEWGQDLHLWEGAVKEEKIPHTRKPLQWQRWGLAGGKLRSHGGEHSNRGVEGKVERFLHRGSVLSSTHQPERLVCSPAGTGGGWEMRLWLWRLDPRERTGVACVNTA